MKAKHLLLSFTFAIAMPAIALSRPVSFTTELSNYGGNGAYLARYLTDMNGKYKQTLWVSGKKVKYYKHLADWARGSGMKPAEYDGMTGASVLSGTTLKLTLDVDDSLIDAGYQVRIDTAVEDKRDNRADVVAPLTTEGANKTIAGKGYVKAFSYSF